MAATATELPSSRTYTPGLSAELNYLIKGTVDEAEAVAALEAASPLTFNSLTRQPVSIEPRKDTIDEDNPTKGMWDGTVEYAPYTIPEPQQVGDSTTGFKTGGGSVRRTQSLETINSHGAPGVTVEDYGGAIGYDGERVAGVDVVIPQYEWTETHILADEDVNSYVYFILTGTTNNAAFRGFNEGEVLFVGASGSKRADDEWEITFTFVGSVDTVEDVGPIVSVPKGGHEYLWVRYDDEEGEEDVIRTPISAYVERVYDAGDFSALRIG